MMAATGTEYRSDEMMAVAGAREIADGQVCFIGIGLPGRAAILAKNHHAPHAVLVYESGVLDTAPVQAPLSIGDGDLAVTARTIVSLPDMFNYWLQGGRIDLGFLGAAQIDRFGNINTTVIGPYLEPEVRLPGAGGAPEIAGQAGETIIMTRHTPRALVETLDFVTTVGHLDGTQKREDLSLRGRGPRRLVTDLGILSTDPQTHEFVLTGLYEGVSRATIEERTGWNLRVDSTLEVIEPPSSEELAVLRRISR